MLPMNVQFETVDIGVSQYTPPPPVEDVLPMNVQSASESIAWP